MAPRPARPASQPGRSTARTARQAGHGAAPNTAPAAGRFHGRTGRKTPPGPHSRRAGGRSPAPRPLATAPVRCAVALARAAGRPEPRFASTRAPPVGDCTVTGIWQVSVHSTAPPRATARKPVPNTATRTLATAPVRECAETGGHPACAGTPVRPARPCAVYARCRRPDGRRAPPAVPGARAPEGCDRRHRRPRSRSTSPAARLPQHVPRPRLPSHGSRAPVGYVEQSAADRDSVTRVHSGHGLCTTGPALYCRAGGAARRTGSTAKGQDGMTRRGRMLAGLLPLLLVSACDDTGRAGPRPAAAW
jgi:hypothetical protein